MASSWSTIRDEIDATLQAAPYSFTKIDDGISILGNNPVPRAGRELYRAGYFLAPRTVRRGPTMERLSKDRTLGFEIYVGVEMGKDYDTASDQLMEWSEDIIKDLTDCNQTVPSAALVQPSGDVQFVENFEDMVILYAIMPFRAVYRMP